MKCLDHFPPNFLLMPSKIIDLTALTPIQLEWNCKIDGVERKIVVRDPSMTHIVVAEYMKEVLADYEKASKGKKRDSQYHREKSDVLVKQIYALLCIDNEITEDDVRKLGYHIISRIQQDVLNATQQAFLVESSLAKLENQNEAKQPENTTPLSDTDSSLPA